jgi:hypothetical protein
VKVTRQMQIGITQGKHEVDWDSNDPYGFTLTIHGKDDNYVTVEVNRGALIDLPALLKKAIDETDKERKRTARSGSAGHE